MTADPPGSPAAGGARSLEVRWIFPGQLEAAVAGWFGRFPARTETREDTYLVDPRLRGLSVKIRGGVALEVKVYRGSPGILEVAGRARGRMQSWRKWSFPVSPLGPDRGDLPGWRPVRKRRRISRFSPASGPVAAHATGLGQEPRCAMELTEVRTAGQDWWTLGLEAAGPADPLRSELQVVNGGHCRTTANGAALGAALEHADPSLPSSAAPPSWRPRWPGSSSSFPSRPGGAGAAARGTSRGVTPGG